MNIHHRMKQRGFTLVEMLLVMVVISALFYMGIRYMDQKTRTERIDRTVTQMQQILNSSLAYYISQNAWPVGATAWSSTSILQNAGFLTPGTFANPWAPVLDTATYPSSYSLGTDTQKKQLHVITYIGTGLLAAANARVIAGKLPLAQACKTFNKDDTTACAACAVAADPCYVVTSINIPGQNLNNAMSVNFAGLFHSGACVKAPTCPLSTMEPIIIVVPTAVAGITEAPTGTNCNANNLQNCQIITQPVTSYIGYATALHTSAGTTPAPNICGSTTTSADCLSDSNGTKITNAVAGDKYWRVCIGIDTSNGRVSPTGGNSNPWGQLSGTVSVFTRCALPNENSKNSGFNVYQ